MNLRKIYFLLIPILVLGSCTDYASNGKSYKEDVELNILSVEFDSTYKHLYVNVQMNDSITEMLLNNERSLHFKAEELVKGNLYAPRIQPVLEGYENLKIEELARLNLNILVLADLTLNAAEMENQQRTIRGLRKLFVYSPFRIAFMDGTKVTETMEATDYVLEHYLKAVPGERKYLYRSILDKAEEFLNDTLSVQSVERPDSLRVEQGPEQKVLIVFSDGKVYDQNKPLDPDHFQLQRKLAQNDELMDGITVFYVNLEQTSEEEGPVADTDEEARNFLTALCQKSGGKYLESSDQHLVLNDIVRRFNPDYADYRFTFVNPDFKIYRGMGYKLQLGCYEGDSLIASDYAMYNAGSVYNPIIINGQSTFQIIVQGGLIGILTLALLYVFFQFILPAVRYWLFKRKYVTRYVNKNMSYNGTLVGQSCYFCKAPFEEGDEIVVKCSHVLHKSCWDENEYKCPEYGRHCKQGSHYYNRKNLFDLHNASFYFRWILAGASAGLVAWIFFTANAHYTENLLLVKLIRWMFDLMPDSPQAAMLMEEYGGHLLYLPFYGMNIGFFLTLSLSLLTGHGQWLWKRSLLVVAKALVGGVCSYLAFFVGCIISLSLNFIDNSFLIDWIPWMLSGFIIAFVVAYGTDIKLKKALVGAAISIVFGLGSMYLWSFSYSVQIDTREFLLLSYMIYCVGFAVSVAATSPKSERYFLRVEGPIKEMDIAVYKWMNAAQRHKRVLIGKSVNCDLQMSWDITSPIAPEQAEVSMINGYLYLTALEEGILFNKKPLKTNIRKKLYHGTKFVIGKTTFTYLEKDL